MIKLGYSLGESKPKFSLKERIKILMSVETHAVEVSFIVADRLNETLDAEDIENIKQFDSISIHAPAIDTEKSKKRIRYPGKEGNAMIDQLLVLADTINANFILFHPDAIDDFGWINNKVGTRLALENMDVSKPFGNTVEDLEQAFMQAPDAKWVCDVNHIYTMDKTMKLSEQFHKKLQDKLCYYHLSGFGDWHDALHLSQEDVILDGIKDLSKPIIDEGRALRDGKESLLKENKYILDRLQVK